MDSAADSLLALSNTAAAIAAHDEPLSDDDRSSSLSELDENLDDAEDEDIELPRPADVDSEAETERLQVTPEGLVKKNPFQVSPSKLAQRADVDMRPEIESLTESPVSSPISSHADSDIAGELSDAPDADDEVEVDRDIVTGNSPNKRKREESESDAEEAPRSQRRRTGSLDSQDDKSEPESEPEDSRRQSRERTIEPGAEMPGPEDEEVEEEPKEIAKVESSEDSKDKARSRPRRKAKGDVSDEAQADEEDEAEGAEESEAVDENDAEAAAKSEEEQARRMAAMEALTSLEKHFAALRDRLYDERIAAINHELALLQSSRPSHPELLRQLEAVQKHRDEKFEVEQKLLVYKVGALKNKAVAERSQIHSQYFQTVRDIRERYLERISEHFYRIQRDRFKADSSIPSYIIPFPEKRSQQILQQTAYNKEVSILSGVAKYVGFPAAPELASSKQKDVEDDMHKMGISLAQVRPTRQSRPVQSTAAAQLSAPQAEEQFLEQTPWANPQHPIHRLSRQNSNRSPLNEFLTPANQQRTTDGLAPVGSASTIADSSAQISSAINTPHDGQSSTTKMENLAGSMLAMRNDRMHSSPLDTRDTQAKDTTRDLGSSPLNSRAQLASPRASSARPDMTRVSRLGNDSPFRPRDAGTTTAITAGSGFGGTGRFSIR
ncbi:hypothetical protein PV05_04815 [Exophiala xenobiotica]|uniref:Transcriptional regulatory protein DEP1 n=1 Tax=Exophiala xenobiotica TaxID=348802 RepID=A0A0D2EL21_9EURO|nr:uncharacterized protein PV05_04815 [Exophiala xenobiotica]KIW56133.1 hypothetical protein PV05_04815 [Exophiala xenobiotica]